MNQGAGRSAADDLIQPFQIEASAIRGRLVRLGPAVDEILTRHAYPEAVANVLGEALALAGLLAAALKYDGIFTLQTKGDGPVAMLVADITSAGDLRGYAQFDPLALAAVLGETGPLPSLPRLLGAGYLAFTVDQGAHSDRYQGIVELTGASLADCVHHYFRQSEQLEAAVKVAAGRDGEGQWRAGGLMIQRIAETGGTPVAGTEIEEAWRRAAVFMASSTSSELIDSALPHDRLLYRLFHEDGVRVYRPHPLRFACRCSRQRVADMLAALPPAEIAGMKEDGEAEVTCEFCAARYVFNPAELDRLQARNG
jgi:molecular chaperone Hsp33